MSQARGRAMSPQGLGASELSELGGTSWVCVPRGKYLQEENEGAEAGPPRLSIRSVTVH